MIPASFRLVLLRQATSCIQGTFSTWRRNPSTIYLRLGKVYDYVLPSLRLRCSPVSAGEPAQFLQPFVHQCITLNRSVHLREAGICECAREGLLAALRPPLPSAGEPPQFPQPSVFQCIAPNRSVHLRKACGCECAPERPLAAVCPSFSSAGEPRCFP